MYRETDSRGVCVDAPCCGCCGPRGDGDYYGTYEAEREHDYDPYEQDEDYGRGEECEACGDDLGADPDFCDACVADMASKRAAPTTA